MKTMYSQNEATTQFQPVNPHRIEEHGVSIRDYVDLLIEGKKNHFVNVGIGFTDHINLFDSCPTHL